MNGFYAGSFDPFTNGHLHVIKSAAKLFDRLVIGVGVNPAKTRKYNQSKMALVIKDVLEREGITNTKVVVFTGLGVDAAIEYKCDVLVRGIRNGMDYEYEENLASVNEEVTGVDTIYIRAGQLGSISSSMVRELLKHKKDISKYVPIEVLDFIKEKQNEDIK